MLSERLYLVTDRRLVPGGELAQHVEAALLAAPPGTVLVQLREKDLGGRDLYDLAAALRRVTRQSGARLLINSRVDVALAAGADGVHLPEDGLPVEAARALLGAGKLVGASAHSAARARELAARGADLVTLGPVWATPSKAGYGAPLGPAHLAAAPGLAIFALGGVDDTDRAGEAIRSGAHGVGVVRAVMAAKDPGAAVTALLAATSRP